jgi:hypothetical protein
VVINRERAGARACPQAVEVSHVLELRWAGEPPRQAKLGEMDGSPQGVRRDVKQLKRQAQPRRTYPHYYPRAGTYAVTQQACVGNPK